MRSSLELANQLAGAGPGANTSVIALAADSGVDLVVARLDADHATTSALAPLLSTDERHRAGLFALDRDRRRFTVARARLRQLIGTRLRVHPRAVVFAYGPYGKPALGRGYGDCDLRFNVAHCEDIAVYAFTHGREVGVDVEAVRPIPDADNVAARFFSRREHDSYLALDPRDRVRGFVNCWTRKEAFIKALGAGLRYSLDRFDVSLAPSEPAEFLRVEHTAGADCGWVLHSFSADPSLIGAVVVRQRRADASPAVVPRLVPRRRFARLNPRGAR